MTHEIQHPVAHHAPEDDEATGPVFRHRDVDPRKQSTPHRRHHQAVGPGKVIEIERVECGESWDDSHMLETGEDEHRPEQV